MEKRIYQLCIEDTLHSLEESQMMSVHHEGEKAERGNSKLGPSEDQ